MKIFVSAKTRSKKEYVRKIDETHFMVGVKESPQKGRANAAIIKALAGYFNRPRSGARIVSGHTAHRKIIEV